MITSSPMVFVLPLLFLASWISGGVHAQTTNATCLPAYSWMTNSQGQNPCLVTAWLYFPCYGKTNLEALQTGYQYVGPPSPAQSTTCQCNTVVYSLLSACAVCQNGVGGIQKWPEWTTNCTKIYNETYPNTIPGGTAVPEWAFLDVFNDQGDFDVDGAQSIAAKDLPDVTASASSTSTISSPTTSSTSTPTRSSDSTGTGTSSQSATSTSSAVAEKPARKKVGAIVGGVVGAVVGVLLIGTLAFCIVLRRRRQTQRQQDLASLNTRTTEVHELLPGSVIPSYHVPTIPSEVGSIRGPLYDPNDPRTFPPPHSPAMGYTGLPQVMS